MPFSLVGSLVYLETAITHFLCVVHNAGLVDHLIEHVIDGLLVVLELLPASGTITATFKFLIGELAGDGGHGVADGVEWRAVHAGGVDTGGRCRESARSLR